MRANISPLSLHQAMISWTCDLKMKNIFNLTVLGKQNLAKYLKDSTWIPKKFPYVTIQSIKA